MSTQQGIQNYNEMNDKDKAYLVKLLITIVTSIIAGLITGGIYDENGNVAVIGWGIFLATILGSSLFIKTQFDLAEMTDVQIIRHGIMVCLLTFIFFWVTIFQFVYF